MSSRALFALVDCNNFFVSCERIFRPDLEGKPVVVLSSNDGCAVARSNEAKALGIPMGAPAFKYRHIFKQHDVVQFSANFAIYGDISKRIIDILTTITPRTEVYSVDESFLDISQLPIDDYLEWGKVVRQRILDWVGVPVSIGIAPTKTLAKLASDRAKKNPESGGVLSLQTVDEREKALLLTPIQDVWGVGRRLAPKLRAEGVHTALGLAQIRTQQAQQLMGIHGSQMVSELNGISCLPLELIGQPCKSIARTRTFGEDTNDYYAIEAAIASFATQATYRLRVSKQLARGASLFLTNNKHKPGHRYWTAKIELPMPTADTGEIIRRAVEALTQIYNPSVFYHRAGVMLYDFIPASSLQLDVFGRVNSGQFDTSQSRMEAIDYINKKFGKEHIRYAAELLGNKWQPKYKLRSPRYLTNWYELPAARIR